MEQNTYTQIIRDQTERALWEVGNVIDCVPDDMWERQYCDMPLWKHIYHMLHSLDLWYINPNDPNYVEPWFHVPNLNNLDVATDGNLTREQIDCYFDKIKGKHMGMLMGFIIEATGQWPAVLGLTKPIPSGLYNKFC